MKVKSKPSLDSLSKATTDLQNGIEWFLREYKNGRADNETMLNLSYQLKNRITHFEIVLYEIQEELKTPV